MWTPSYIPRFIDGLTPNLNWYRQNTNNEVYLTFDDGPTEGVTDQVLDILASHHVKATFFCIGNQVKRYPELYQRLLEEGHSIGNHTFHHPNGWKTDVESYVQDIDEASKYISSNLFRPPYGRITLKQITQVKKNYRLILYSHLSKDYDKEVSVDHCIANATRKLSSGCIILMHDSLKAKTNVLGSLESIINRIQNKGFNFGRL